MKFLNRVKSVVQDQLLLSRKIELLQEAIGRLESRLAVARTTDNPRAFEFKVYSQWGEDGIIDHLVSSLDIKIKSFVEFGVENYTEANTIFLLKHRNWKGLIIDGASQNIDYVNKGPLPWKYDLYTDCSFITLENVNDIFQRNGFSGEIGLLSIDIDGNDYWIWERINSVNPQIVVAEYNSVFGPTATVSIPYQADFERSRANRTKLYYGASISALTFLAQSKGYSLVAGNSAGNNAFFVRDDSLGSLKVLTPKQAYIQAAFREASTIDGRLDLLHFSERQAAIAHLPVVNVTTGMQIALKDTL